MLNEAFAVWPPSSRSATYLAARYGISWSSYMIYRSRGHPPEMSVERRTGLLTRAVNELGIPLSNGACRTISSIRYCIDNRRFHDLALHEAYVEDILSRFEKDKTGGPAVDDKEFKNNLIASYWLLGIKLSPHHKKHELLEYWLPVSRRVLHMLEERNSEDWAVLLHYCLEFNVRVAVPWNTSKVSDRDSDHFRSTVEDMRFFDKAMEINKTFPWYRPAPFNRLAISSNFRRRDLYPTSWERLIIADTRYEDTQWIIDTHAENTRLAELNGERHKSKGRTKKSDDPLLNADFDDFVTWLQTENAMRE